MKPKFFIPIVAASLALVACEKKEAAQDKPGQNPLNAPSDYHGAMGKAQQKAYKTVDAASINQAIQVFEGAEGRHPKDLNELVSLHYMPTMPTPPQGMKFDYDPNTGIVKVVPAK
jgi:hypothetical protein